MTSVSVHEAKAHFSRLLRQAEEGHEIEITRHNRVVARIVPAEGAKKRPLLGAFKGQVLIDDRFFEPLPDDELNAWYGE